MMTKKEAKKIMEASFKSLPKRDRDRLMFHAEKKTPILCGDYAYLFWKDGAA